MGFPILLLYTQTHKQTISRLWNRQGLWNSWILGSGYICHLDGIFVKWQNYKSQFFQCFGYEYLAGGQAEKIPH